VHAAIDVSDGLSSDLGHVADESNVGFILYAAAIPVSDALKQFCEHFTFDATDFSLAGGEDYVLVFTVKASASEKVVLSYEKKFGKKIFRIGEITEGKERILKYKDGKSRSIEAKGWDHFRE